MVAGGSLPTWHAAPGRGEGTGVRATGTESRGGEEEPSAWGPVRGGGPRLPLEVGLEPQCEQRATTDRKDDRVWELKIRSSLWDGSHALPGKRSSQGGGWAQGSGYGQV